MSLGEQSTGGEIYRTVSEANIIDMLVFEAFVYELQAGGEIARQARLATQSALNGWVDQGLEHQKTVGGGRLFDPAEVTRFMILAHLEGRDPFWFDHLVLQRRRMVTELMTPAQLADPHTAPRRFHLELQRMFRTPATGGKVRLRLPLPIPGTDLERLDIAPLDHLDGAAQITVTEGRLQARLHSPPGQSVTLGVRLSFTARHHPRYGAAITLSDEDRSLYLRAREGLIAVTDRVLALAFAITGPRLAADAAVDALWDHIYARLRLSPIHYDQVDPAAPSDWILDNGWSDCQLGCALFVSLCRGIGVPARLVSGYFLYSLMPTRHYWAEIWSEGRGWAPYDLFGWSLAGGGQDPHWRNYFMGRLDYRLTTERFPGTFTGALGVDYPPIWHMISTFASPGAEMSFVGPQGEVFYKDTLRLILGQGV